MTAPAASHARMGVSDTRQLPSGQCEICSRDNKNRPAYLTIEYVPQGVDSQYQDSSKASCVEGWYPPSTTLEITNKDGNEQVFDVQAGSVFRVGGPFDAVTQLSFSGGSACSIHTSCSVPLVAGDQIGPFKVLAGNECNVGNFTTAVPFFSEPEECVICSKENKNKPDKLTLQYKSDGESSEYQDSSVAPCIEGIYPTSTTIAMTNKDGKTQLIPVVDGSVFEIDGPFQADTVFEFGGGSSCSIHLSCSVPLVAGDQIGPFVVLEGNECKYETSAPSSSPSSSPSSLPTNPKPTKSPSPTASPTAQPSPSPTAQPSLSPTAQPSPSPSSKPSPSPSSKPTGTPSTPPTPGPSSSPTNSPTASMAPTQAVCVAVDKPQYPYGDEILVSYNINFNPVDPLLDGWICVYPCDVTDYFDTRYWECGNAPGNCWKADSTGEFVFNDASSLYPWPVSPFVQPDGSINDLFKAVVFRNVPVSGGSPADTVPVEECTSDCFRILEFEPSCPQA